MNWVGTNHTAAEILDDRLRSADGAYRALQTLLVRCQKAGPELCEFAGGNPVAKFAAVAARLRAKPIVVPDSGEKVTYADFIGAVLTQLYRPDSANEIIGMALTLYNASGLRGAVPASASAAATRELAELVQQARASQVPGRDFPYDNGFEAYSGVICTDGLHPKDAANWPALTAAADKRAPYFGRAWGWSTAQCPGKSWTVRDEDAYTGPFNRRTSAPVLIVGNYYDPATNYVEAVAASKLLPNSRLLSSDSWGHTAYGTSACTTSAVDAYLVRGALPATGKVCVGDDQPFAKPTGLPQEVHAGKDLPPVFVPERPSILLGTR